MPLSRNGFTRLQSFAWPESVLAGGKTRDCKMLLGEHFDRPEFVLGEVAARDCNMSLSESFDRPGSVLARRRIPRLQNVVE